MTRTALPIYSSLAFEDQPRPDWALVTVEALPPGAPTDPRRWADEVFSARHAPRLVLALMAARQVLVRLIGIPRPAPTSSLSPRSGARRALIVRRERHLDFRCGVGVDVESGRLWVTTAVWLHGWRGHLYFAPVAVAHDPLTRMMMRAAIRRLA